MSAVSKKFMPASSAASTTRALAASSIRIPKLLQPRPASETRSDPIERMSIGSLWRRLTEDGGGRGQRDHKRGRTGSIGRTGRAKQLPAAAKGPRLPKRRRNPGIDRGEQRLHGERLGQ